MAKNIFMNWFSSVKYDMFQIPPFDIREYEFCCDFEEAVDRMGVDFDQRLPKECYPDLVIIDKAMIKYFVYFRKVQRCRNGCCPTMQYVIQQSMDRRCLLHRFQLDDIYKENSRRYRSIKHRTRNNIYFRYIKE